MSALNELRRRLGELHTLVEAEDYDAVIAASKDPAVVARFVALCGDVDFELTGNRIHADNYQRHVQELLTGGVWLWHLADGGYSRLTACIAEDPVIFIDRSLSTARVVAAWDRLNAARP